VKAVQLVADGPDMIIAADGGKKLEISCVDERKHENNSIHRRLVVSHLVTEVPT
jgi:hypothetical protein